MICFFSVSHMERNAQETQASAPAEQTGLKIKILRSPACQVDLPYEILSNGNSNLILTRCHFQE